MADQPYKLELIEEHAGKGEAIAFRRQGDLPTCAPAPTSCPPAPSRRSS